MGKVYTRFSQVNQKHYFIHQLVQALLWRIQGRGRPPLFVDQTEARRAEKIFFSETAPLPPYLTVWMTGPPPLISRSGSGTAL